MGRLGGGRGVGHPKFIGQHEESRVCSPHSESTDHCGCQNVHVDPANTSPEKSSFTHKLNNLLVGDRLSLLHLRVSIEKVPSAASNVANEQFAENHLVADDLVPTKNFVKAAGEWLTASQEPDPDRSIHQDHQATLRLLGCSRRRGTSRARGSAPRSARNRS